MTEKSFANSPARSPVVAVDSALKMALAKLKLVYRFRDRLQLIHECYCEAEETNVDFESRGFQSVALDLAKFHFNDKMQENLEHLEGEIS